MRAAHSKLLIVSFHRRYMRSHSTDIVSTKGKASDIIFNLQQSRSQILLTALISHSPLQFHFELLLF